MVDLLLHGGVRLRPPLDRRRVAEHVTGERVEGGVLGVVVSGQRIDDLADDAGFARLGEAREQRFDTAVVGEDQLDSVRHGQTFSLVDG